MWSRRFNFLNWPIGTKLAVTYVLAILLPILAVIIPQTSQSRISSVREQTATRLETLGPLEIARTLNTIQSLAAFYENFISREVNDNQIQSYLYQATLTSSEAQNERLNQIVVGLFRRVQVEAPSVTHLTFFNVQGSVLARASLDGSNVLIQNERPSSISLPSQLAIQAQKVGDQPRASDIYKDEQDRPVIDVIISFQPNLDSSGNPIVLGYIVFSQDLLLAPDDPSLSDLYASLLDVPEGNLPTNVYVLNNSGQLIVPHGDFPLLSDSYISEGFRAAQRGEIGVSTYDSPLTGKEVLGYYNSAALTEGPTITYLIETPTDSIFDDAMRALWSPLLVAIAGSVLLGTVATVGGTFFVARPISRLTRSARSIAGGQLNIELPHMSRQDEIGVLNNTLSDMAHQLITAINELEVRVAERTRNLETTLEIGHALSSIRDLDALLEDVVNLIRDQFDTIYHAQVFLIDTRTNQAKLRASTGVAGLQLLQRGHYLEVGSQSVIGNVTASGHAVVALDTSSNPLHKRNEFLPDTHAEMALPLRLGNQVIGALDLQSKQPDAFSDQDVELFQGMADQIAIAIENALLFSESNARLKEIESLNQLLTQTAWSETFADTKRAEYSASIGGTGAPAGHWTPLQITAMQTKQIAEQRETDWVTFAVPILLRGTVLGAIEWQVPAARYSNEVRQTAQELTTRLAFTADNIRLFEHNRQIAQRELLVNQISSKLTSTTDIDEILQTAVRELGLALHISQTAVRLIPPSSSDNGGSNDMTGE